MGTNNSKPSEMADGNDGVNAPTTTAVTTPTTIPTIMTPEHPPIDECIMQVFEEQPDAFFFPLRSQKTARAFVKAMHAKGLPFEAIGGEIGEFEHNFSAWRKGLGRIGIGKRMLTRINQPFQDLLDSEDEDDNAFLNIDKPFKATSTPGNRPQHNNGLNGNNNTTNTTQNGSNSMPLHKLDRDSAKEKSRDLTEAWTKNIEDKMARIEKDRKRDEEDERKRSEDTSDSSSSRSTRESTPKHATKEERELSESAKVFERIRGKKPMQDEEESTPAPAPTPAPKEEKVVTKEVVTRTKSKPDEETDKRKSVKDLIATKETSSSTPASPSHSSSDSKADESREDRLTRLQEKIAMLKKKFPKGENGEEKDSSDSSSSNRGTPSPTPKSPLSERKSSPIVEQRASPKPKSPLVSRSSSRSDSPAVSSPKRVSSSSADDNHRISLKQVADVTENYDSDLDIDALPEEEVTFEARNLVSKLRTLKHSQQDGAGYLYIFGSETGSEFKIGASRFPSARLEQAQLFNPSLEMLLSVSVSRRREGLRKAAAALETSAMPGTVNWYAGDKQAITDKLMEVADTLGETSMC